MSTIERELPPRRLGGKPAYPWHEWTDGQVHTITEGTDFTVPVLTIKSTIYSYATRHRLAVTVRKRLDSLTFQFTPPAVP